MSTDSKCPPPPSRMTRQRKEVEVNSALCDLQLKLDMTDIDMVMVLLSWIKKTLTYNTVREPAAAPADDASWAALGPNRDSLPDALKLLRPEL